MSNKVGPAAMNDGADEPTAEKGPPTVIATTIPQSDARVTRLPSPCCDLHHGDAMLTPTGDEVLVVSVGPIHIQVIDSNGARWVFLPTDLSAA